jgi:carbon monoxide dehydrogenase subunit G
MGLLAAVAYLGAVIDDAIDLVDDLIAAHAGQESGETGGRRILEVVHETSVRVEAPVDAVWGEVGTLQGLLRYLPGIEGYEIAPGHREATVHGTFRWGPVRFVLAGVVAAVEVEAPHRVVFVLRDPGLGMTFVGELVLDPIGGESRLTYRGTLRCGHRYMARMRRVTTGWVEESMDFTVSRLATLTTRHVMAERLLGSA